MVSSASEERNDSLKLERPIQQGILKLNPSPGQVSGRGGREREREGERKGVGEGEGRERGRERGRSVCCWLNREGYTIPQTSIPSPGSNCLATTTTRQLNHMFARQGHTMAKQSIGISSLY